MEAEKQRSEILWVKGAGKQGAEFFWGMGTETHWAKFLWGMEAGNRGNDSSEGCKLGQ